MTDDKNRTAYGNRVVEAFYTATPVEQMGLHQVADRLALQREREGWELVAIDEIEPGAPARFVGIDLATGPDATVVRMPGGGWGVHPLGAGDPTQPPDGLWVARYAKGDLENLERLGITLRGFDPRADVAEIEAQVAASVRASAQDGDRMAEAARQLAEYAGALAGMTLSDTQRALLERASASELAEARRRVAEKHPEVEAPRHLEPGIYLDGERLGDFRVTSATVYVEPPKLIRVRKVREVATTETGRPVIQERQVRMVGKPSLSAVADQMAKDGKVKGNRKERRAAARKGWR
jgi:hypothetical protein